jgi:hypothetical protein
VWRKSPDALIVLFDAALLDDPRVERRKMFGYPCAQRGLLHPEELRHLDKLDRRS